MSVEVGGIKVIDSEVVDLSETVVTGILSELEEVEELVVLKTELVVAEEVEASQLKPSPRLLPMESKLSQL